MNRFSCVDDYLVAGKAAEREAHWDEALLQYRRGLEEARACHDAEGAMDMLMALGRVNYERGEYEDANNNFLECLVTARENRNLKRAAAALNGMAVVAQLRGELEVAEPLYAQAEVLARRMGDIKLTGKIAQNLGTLANTRGDMQTALLRYQTALESFRNTRDDGAAAWVLNNMGMLHTDVGEYPEAELCFNAAYSLARRQGDHATLGKIETNRAELYLTRQNYEAARDACDRAFATFGQLASHIGLGEVHKAYGVLQRETGKLHVAHVQFALALELARRCDNPLLQAETESEIAKTYIAESKFKQAVGALNRAYRIFCELDARREILDLRRRLDRIEEPYMSALQLWVQSDAALRSHRPTIRGRRVAEFACALGAALEYQNLSELRIASYLLEVGAAAIGFSLLEKPELTEEERRIVREHPVRADSVLEALDFPVGIRAIVRHHHERFDGAGYPDGLTATDIPLGARIVALADQYDALTTARPNRPPLSAAVAAAIIRQDAGRAFDPELIPVFFTLDQVRADLTHAQPTALIETEA